MHCRYSLRDGASFAEQARGIAFDLAGDDAVQERKRREMRWDKSKKKFVKGTGEGADNVKMVKTESGVKLPASYRSGRFDEWKAKSRTSIPRVGDAEGQSAQKHGQGGRKWKHNKVTEAKPLDKLGKNYERKMRQMSKKNEHGHGAAAEGHDSKGKQQSKGKKIGGRFNGKPMGKIKNELRTVDQIRKSRKIMEQKRAKNARPTRRKGRR